MSQRELEAKELLAFIKEKYPTSRHVCVKSESHLFAFFMDDGETVLEDTQRLDHWTVIAHSPDCGDPLLDRTFMDTEQAKRELGAVECTSAD